eukprot:scaffold124394_cov78-Phaeocystis_antarctica.AAC.1
MRYGFTPHTTRAIDSVNLLDQKVHILLADGRGGPIGTAGQGNRGRGQSSGGHTGGARREVCG